MRNLRTAKIRCDDGKFKDIFLRKVVQKPTNILAGKYEWVDRNNQREFNARFATVYTAEIFVMENFSIESGELKAKWAHL